MDIEVIAALALFLIGSLLFGKVSSWVGADDDNDDDDDDNDGGDGGD